MGKATNSLGWFSTHLLFVVVPVSRLQPTTSSSKLALVRGAGARVSSIYSNMGSFVCFRVRWVRRFAFRYVDFCRDFCESVRHE